MNKHIFSDTFEWLFDITDWKMLLRSIPGLVTGLSLVCVVIMNLMASKVMIMTPLFAVTGGIVISWLPFLTGDIVTKTYGAKAATKLTILGLIVNLCCIGIFQLVTMIQIGVDASNYIAFNETFKQTWQVFVASSIAFLISGIVNNFSNAALGKLFVKNADSKLAYMVRSYVSTMLGQFIDNVVFGGLAFMVFFKLSIGTTLGYTTATVIGTGFFGALLELFMQVIFSPIGYAICQKWRKDSVGAEYLSYCKEKEIGTDFRRISF